MLAAVLVFGLTYLVIAIQRLPGLHLDRPSGALLGGTAMVLTGVIGFDRALAAIDLDTILFLLGMMIVLAYLELSGFFEVVERRVLMLAHSRSSLLVLTALSSGLLSALFMNDTVCLLLTPVVIRVCRRLELRPTPYLVALATAANVGSAATILGNPQNAFLAVRSGIGLVPFTARLWPVSALGLAVLVAILAWLYRGEMRGDRLTVPPPRQPTRVQPFLLACGLATGAGMVAAMAAGVRPAAAAMTAGGVLVLAGAREKREALARIDWMLLLFFGGLFVVMEGVRAAGLAEGLVHHIAGPLDASSPLGLGRLAAAVALLSQAVSNVPAVMLFVPGVEALPPPAGEPLFLALAAFSTLAGNLTVIGSVANVIVFERARREGVTVSFLEYARVGVPITLATSLLAWAVLLLAGRV